MYDESDAKNLVPETIEDNFFKSEQSHSNLNITENDEQKPTIIKPINRDAIHKICSGQIVLNLSIAVKELVENAIDAGATNIEIKLKEYGSKLIEVIDNGCGVLEQNFAALTRKHYTSKLKEFTDLESVSTLGFRGEALSSLCALSNVMIITRHNTTDIGTKLEYDHNGRIIKQTITSRSEGTTVALSNIFSTLPVRRKEFMKNLKREFNKMCQLLYAYCLVSVNVKITCIHLNKNSKTTIMATQASSSIRENIINIFGAKQISSLLDISVAEPHEAILEEYDLKMIPKEEIPFTFEGFISSVTHSYGRSTLDRQFYYINSRPCELAKVMKLVNEIYRQFNMNQYPFVYLNILIDKKHIDVNVTPDKRQVFLDNEKLVLAVLKSTLLDLFKHLPSNYTMQNLNIPKFKKETPLAPTTKGLKRLSSQDNETSIQTSLLKCYGKKPKKCDSVVLDIKVPKESTCEVTTEKDEDYKYIKNCINTSGTDMTRDDQSKDCRNEIENVQTREDIIINETLVQSKTSNKSNNTIPIKNKIDIHNSITKDDNTIQHTKGKEEKEIDIALKSDKIVVLNTSLDVIEQNIQKKLQNRNKELEDSLLVKFRSAINPDSNAQAEAELDKQITKNKFKKMKIIGQFNLAFIITQLESDLFIIDQHATDEKYNFEQLQMNTNLETQILVNPKELHLTAANEVLLIENEDIFKKNGFVFCINHTAAPTKKVKLTAMPVSKNYSFGKDDIDELLFMLQDGNDTMCRPSRIRQMFASRACRKSVMVGKALTKSDMRKLVDHMGEIDQPWNCPHGRPTMRHLVNLNLIQES